MKRNIFFGIIIIAVIIAAIGYTQYYRFYHDDAYISLRYAMNFLDGKGLVWNPGEKVEGYSNFLLIMLVSLAAKFGVGLVAASKIIGVKSYGLLALFVLFFSLRYFRDDSNKLPSAIPFLLTAASLPLIAWSVGGLETTLYAALITAATWLFGYSLSGGRRLTAVASVLFALAAMTRPDGLLFFAMAVTFLLVMVVIRRVEFDRLILLASPFLLIYLPYFIWRTSYYRSFFPNTYYVKGEITDYGLVLGQIYFYDFSLMTPFLPMLALASAVVITIRRAWTPLTVYLGMTLVVYILYIISIGGDHMPAFRYFVAIVPSLALLIAVGVREFLRWVNRDLWNDIAAAALVVLAASPLIFPPEPVSRAKEMDGAAFHGRVVAAYITANWPAGSLIALNTAGSTPFFAPQNRYIDMLGLNDTTIARRNPTPRKGHWQYVPGHGKGYGAYILNRQPDYIIAGPANGAQMHRPWFLSEREIFGSARFEREFVGHSVSIRVDTIPGYDRYKDSQSGVLQFFYYDRFAPKQPAAAGTKLRY